MQKYPIYKQDNEYSCGAYCLKMILKYYHQSCDIKDIKRECKITTQGITVYGMLQCLNYFHIDAKSYQCDLDHLLQDQSYPYIVLTQNKELSHYMVFYKLSKDKVILGDPAKGLIKMYIDDFEKIYTGIMIKMIHVGRPRTQKHHQTFKEFLLVYLKDHYRDVAKVAFFSFVLTLMAVITSYYFQLLLDQVKTYSYFYILIYTLFFMVLFGLKNLMNYKKGELTIDIKKNLDQYYIIKTMKDALYLPFDQFYQSHQGAFLNQVHNLMIIGDFFIQFYNIVFIDGFLIVGVLIVLSLYQIEIAILVMIILCCVGGVMYYAMKSMSQIQMNMMNEKERINHHIEEYYKNYYQIRQFHFTRFFKSKVHFIMEEYLKITYQKDHLSNQMNNLVEGFLQISLLGIVLYALYFYKKQVMTIGDMMMIYMLASSLIEPLSEILTMIVAKDEVALIYERYSQMIPPEHKRKKKIKTIHGIALERVSVGYGYGRPMVEDVNLDLHRSLWLKGPTGSGKTTLLKLLTKQNVALNGIVRINGINIDDIDQNILLQHIVYLDKEPLFINESLKFNMILDRYDEQKMMEWLHYFELDELIERLEMKLDIEAQSLSSGQKQLVMLIRALLKNPDVFILDEALCNVDEQRVIKALKLLDDKIVIIVSHSTNVVIELYDCAIIDSGFVKEG